jgi:hypothetical protein
MSEVAFSGLGDESAETEHDDVVRALTVECFTRWKPSTSAKDRTEMLACPTVRDGLPFEPIARSVPAWKYRGQTAASRRSS